MPDPVVLAVEFVSANRAAIRVAHGDGIYWTFVNYEQGERLLRELLAINTSEGRA